MLDIDIMSDDYKSDAKQCPQGQICFCPYPSHTQDRLFFLHTFKYKSFDKTTEILDTLSLCLSFWRLFFVTFA